MTRENTSPVKKLIRCDLRSLQRFGRAQPLLVQFALESQLKPRVIDKTTTAFANTPGEGSNVKQQPDTRRSFPRDHIRTQLTAPLSVSIRSYNLSDKKGTARKFIN